VIDREETMWAALIKFDRPELEIGEMT